MQVIHLNNTYRYHYCRPNKKVKQINELIKQLVCFEKLCTSSF